MRSTSFLSFSLSRPKKNKGKKELKLLTERVGVEPALERGVVDAQSDLGVFEAPRRLLDVLDKDGDERRVPVVCHDGQLGVFVAPGHEGQSVDRGKGGAGREGRVKKKKKKGG